MFFFWAPSAFDFVIKETLNPEAHIALPPIQDAIPKFGYVPIALFIIGAGIIVRRGGRENWALVLSAIVLLAFEQIYPRFYIGPDILYERGWLYTYVMMALLGGVALVEIGRWIQAALRHKQTQATVLSYALVGVIALSALGIGIQSRLSEPYYHVIDEETYKEFLWIKEYMPSQYQIGVLKTDTAWAFAAVTGKFAYTTEVAPNFHEKGRSARAFLHEGAKDTAWLKERGITIVYAPGTIDNSDLIKVHNSFYLLAE